MAPVAGIVAYPVALVPTAPHVPPISELHPANPVEWIGLWLWFGPLLASLGLLW